MLISCLTVTRPGRLALLRHCIDDFVHQTHPERELVIVHDGGPDFDASVQALTADARHPAIQVHSVAGASLGELRNRSVALARGELICQWDDDDRYHPQRIALQYRALTEGRADFCFLQDQLHWFVASGQLSWDDWSQEAYPLDFVQGTLLGRRDRMPVYPAAVRGEDTQLCYDILRNGHRVARLKDAGWCYIYVFHGRNAFDAMHHAAITREKRMPLARLMAREGNLRERLAEYAPPLPRAFYATPGGVLDFSIGKTTGSSSSE